MRIRRCDTTLEDDRILRTHKAQRARLATSDFCDYADTLAGLKVNGSVVISVMNHEFFERLTEEKTPHV